MAQIKVELIDNMGTDLTVANSARVSFDKTSNWERGECLSWGASECVSFERKLSDRDTKLINYLATHNHITPFTHPQIQVRETVPIFVARQRFKHVVGFTYNEISRRYVDDAPEFYTPDVWRGRAENKKQGSGETIITNLNFVGRFDDTNAVSEHYDRAIQHTVEVYERMIESGVSPEMARMVLPQSMMTSYYCTGSLAAFARAYNLRSYPDAQKEIQDVATQWDGIIRPLYPVAWSALVDNNKE